MITLALLRHGHTAWNRAGQIQGRTDIPLDDDALAMLSALRLPPRWHDAALVSSPLSRAVQTAQLVSGRAPLAEPVLMEMDWGVWEGKKGLELDADPTSGFRHIEDWGWDFAPPQGESTGQLRDRLLPWVHGLQTDTVAVCHIGVMRVLMALATGWAFDGPAPFQIKRNRLYLIEVSKDGLRALPDLPRLIEAPQ